MLILHFFLATGVEEETEKEIWNQNGNANNNLLIVLRPRSFLLIKPFIVHAGENISFPIFLFLLQGCWIRRNTAKTDVILNVTLFVFMMAFQQKIN